jgi:hypothetical protein
MLRSLGRISWIELIAALWARPTALHAQADASAAATQKYPQRSLGSMVKRPLMDRPR